MEIISVYTDGSASNSVPIEHRIGGFAALVLIGEEERLVSGSSISLTSQQAELMAVILALLTIYDEDLALNAEVVVYSDSAYIVNCFLDKWWEMWKINGFSSIKNSEYWLVLLDLVFERGMKVRFKKVKGHSGDKFNELVDKAARKARLEHA